MTGKLFAVTAFAGMLAIGCKKESAINTVTPTDTMQLPTTIIPADTLPENKIDRAFLLQLLNGLRSRGCNCGGIQMPATGAVSWNGKLEQAAWLHSKDMSGNNYFDHKGKNGSSPGNRLDAVGYNWTNYGENIAKGQMAEQAVVLGWLNSPDHCRNMMNPAFRELGAGKYGDYWTMVLGCKTAN